MAARRPVLDAATYLVGGILQRGGLFLLLPFLIATLSPADFTRFGLFTSLIALLPRVLSLNVHSASTRLVFDYRMERDRAGLLKTVLFSSLAFSTLLTVGAIVGLHAAGTMDPVTGGDVVLQVGIALVVLWSVCVQFALAVARIHGRARMFAVTSMLQSVGVVGLYVGISYVVDGGFPLVVAAYTVGLGIVACGGLVAVRPYWGSGAFRPGFIRVALPFAAPTVLNLVAAWVVGSSGRWIGVHFVDLDSMAGYVLLTFLLGGVGLLGRSLFDAALPAISEAFATGRAAAGEQLAWRTATIAAGLVVLVYACIAATVWWLPVPIPDAYVPAPALVGVAFVASIFDCMYLYGMQALTGMKRTDVQAAVGIGAAALVIVLSVALARSWGVLGLITATAAGSGVQGLASLGLARYEFSRSWDDASAVVQPLEPAKSESDKDG